MAKVRVQGTQAKGSPSVNVEIEGVTQKQYNEIRGRFRHKARNIGLSDWIAYSFLDAIRRCPSANPSDLWLYAIYMEYVKNIGNEQSWKRASGFAFERVLQRFYFPIFNTRDLEILVLKQKDQMELLSELGLSNVDIPPAKLDMAIKSQSSGRTISVLHAKVSLAERISDDAPASRFLMDAGCKSIVMTFDMKHFPPPHGDGVNYGELGGKTKAVDLERVYQQKRAYIEESGDFDALFSFNKKTPPSPERTNSGKRIHVLTFSDPQPDAFVSWICGL